MNSPKVNPLPELPPEVLEHIFRHLSASDLHSARLVCLRWDAIIRESVVLMKRFDLFFCQRLLKRCCTERGLLDQVLQFKSLGGISFVRTTAHPLQSIAPFWDQFGAKLERVSFKECVLSAQTVLQVLRRTPNLKSFSLDESSVNTMAYYTPTWASFRLERLEKLDLHVADDRFLNLFGQLAPNLRVLKFDGKWMVGDQLFKTLLPLIRSRKDTLKKVTLKLIQASPELLNEIGSTEGLQLTAISLQNWEIIEDQNIAQFLQNQRSLEQFKCNTESYLGSAILDRLMDTQSKLRCVQISLKTVDLPRFFMRSPYLKHLKLSLGDSQIIDLSRNRSPKLEKLHLTGYNILKARLASFLQHSPNLRYLTLENCRQPSITELVDTLGELRSLESLKLSNHSAKVGALSTVYNSTKNLWPHLTTLHLRSCHLAAGTIAALIHRAPNLTSVLIENVTPLHDTDILSVSRDLRRLRLLTVTHPRNDLSETSLGYLKKYGRGLKRLEFSIAGAEIIEKCRDREFAKALPGVEIEMIPREPGEDGLGWYDDFDEL